MANKVAKVSNETEAAISEIGMVVGLKLMNQAMFIAHSNKDCPISAAMRLFSMLLSATTYSKVAVDLNQDEDCIKEKDTEVTDRIVTNIAEAAYRITMEELQNTNPRPSDN